MGMLRGQLSRFRPAAASGNPGPRHSSGPLRARGAAGVVEQEEMGVLELGRVDGVPGRRQTSMSVTVNPVSSSSSRRRASTEGSPHSILPRNSQRLDHLLVRISRTSPASLKPGLRRWGWETAARRVWAADELHPVPFKVVPSPRCSTMTSGWLARSWLRELYPVSTATLWMPPCLAVSTSCCMSPTKTWWRQGSREFFLEGTNLGALVGDAGVDPLKEGAESGGFPPGRRGGARWTVVSRKVPGPWVAQNWVIPANGEGYHGILALPEAGGTTPPAARGQRGEQTSRRSPDRAGEFGPELLQAQRRYAGLAEHMVAGLPDRRQVVHERPRTNQRSRCGSRGHPTRRSGKSNGKGGLLVSRQSSVVSRQSSVGGPGSIHG